jgi:hypothetical protein
MLIESAFRRAASACAGTGRASGLRLAQLCAVCADITSLSTSIVLFAHEGQQATVAGVGVAALVEYVQLTLGEGSAFDAYTQGRPVLSPDLAKVVPRWMHFVPAVQTLDVGAAFAYPISIGSSTSSVCSFYGSESQADDRQVGDFARLVHLVIDCVLVMQSNESEEESAEALSSAVEHRPVEHPAAGMISVHCRCHGPLAGKGIL